MKKVFIVFSILLLVLVSVNLSKADSTSQTVNFIVLDFNTNNPISEASITIPGTSWGVTTDIDGKASLTLPLALMEGSLDYKVSALGYQKYTAGLAFLIGVSTKTVRLMEEF